jgi:hypothetical protein
MIYRTRPKGTRIDRIPLRLENFICEVLSGNFVRGFCLRSLIANE